MERREILGKLILIIRRITLKDDIEHLNEEDDFKETFGMDSLDMTLLAIRCEKEFKIVFTEEMFGIKKVGDLVDFIQRFYQK